MRLAVTLCLLFIVLGVSSNALFSWFKNEKIREVKRKVPVVFDLTRFRERGAIYDVDQDFRGRIYIPDLSHDSIIVLDHSLNYLLTIKNIPTPHSVAFDSEGFLYVATHRSGRVLKFDKNYKEVKNWDYSLRREHKMIAPVVIRTDSKGNVYIGDWLAYQVIKVTSRGEYILTFEAGKIKERGEFKPHGIAINKDMVLVADRGVGSIQTFTHDGEQLGAWYSSSKQFDPLSVRFLGPDLLMVPNYKNGSFHIFSISGKELEILAVNGDSPGKILSPTNFVTDKHGYIYVSELNGDRIQLLDYQSIIARHNGRVTENNNYKKGK
ncbi:NHL repeat-containing protein [Candidatus Margulisiibacteriota bacterium]